MTDTRKGRHEGLAKFGSALQQASRRARELGISMSTLAHNLSSMGRALDSEEFPISSPEQIQKRKTR